MSMVFQQETDQLQKEIDEGRQEIRSQKYSMSIGELISMYETNEINVHPEFQRFFRWTSYQKTSLIESLLLGIPIPPIFVAQRSDGVWDVVDGVQRLSTIYELMGKLKDEEGRGKPPLVLEETRYLPSLAGKSWENSEDSTKAFTHTQQLLFKRAKIDVTILERESDVAAKYELFQRLNTGGSIATPQEVRNCILIMYNRDLFNWMKDLCQYQPFQDCIALSDRSKIEQYDMELLSRFLVFRTMERSKLKKIGDISVFLNKEMMKIADNKSYNYQEEENAFKLTFDILAAQTDSDSFRKYDSAKGRFTGGFLVSAFEVIALGIGYNYERLKDNRINLRERIEHIWINTDYPKLSGGGTDTKRRVPKLIPLGREVFE
jgi:uncharacterized protein with ParB-like and HNH nuclease domain